MRDEEEMKRLTAGFEAKHGKVRRRVLKPKPAKLVLTAEAMLWRALVSSGLDYGCERQHRFSAERKWTFDFAWPNQWLAVELDGQGRHQRVIGERNDMEKGREATRLGWRVLHWQSMQVTKESAGMAHLIRWVLENPEQPCLAPYAIPIPHGPQPPPSPTVGPNQGT